MKYSDVLDQWRQRRKEIRAKYATKKYTIRSLAAEYGITDARIWVILHDDKPSK